MRSDWCWFEDGVVGIVSYWCLGKDFDNLVDIPSFSVAEEVVHDASDFFGVFLGVGSPVVGQALAHRLVLYLDIGCRRSEIFYVSVQVVDDCL